MECNLYYIDYTQVEWLIKTVYIYVIWILVIIS